MQLNILSKAFRFSFSFCCITFHPSFDKYMTFSIDKIFLDHLITKTIITSDKYIFIMKQDLPLKFSPT